MVQINWLAVVLAGLVPLLVGAIWYNPKVLGTAWMDAAGMTEEKIKGANMPLIFGLTLVFGMLCSAFLIVLVIHQMHIGSTLMSEPDFKNPSSPAGQYIANFLKLYGNNFRTFKHGAFHGVMAGLLFVLPIFSINAMFERKGFKYIAINVGYWTLCFAIMGAMICGWR